MKTRVEEGGRVSSDNEFGIPAGILGPIQPELPALIGRVVMLAAVVENKVAAVTSSIDNKPQGTYFAAALQANVRTCERRFGLFERSSYERETVALTRAFLSDVVRVMQERNDIVHRVWPHAVAEPWGGHKEPRTSKAKAGATSPAAESHWKEYSSSDLRRLIGELVDLCRRAEDVVPRVASLERRP